MARQPKRATIGLDGDNLADLRRKISELEKELASRTAERDEAAEQQKAASEILRVISRSPADIQPVFEAIVARAARLCEAEFSAVASLEEDGLFHLLALHSMSPEEAAAFHSLFPRPPAGNFVMGRAFLDAQPMHFEDVLAWQDYDARTVQVLQSVAQYRSFLAVPIFTEGRPIGVIGCGRREVKPFTATQIELLKIFADQAAIALENVRLFNELGDRNRDLGEALEQQTATAEVLQVINSSPGDLAPVFDAMLEKATHLCDAAAGVLWVAEDDRFRSVASRGLPSTFEEFLRTPIDAGPETGIGRLRCGAPIAHIADMTEGAGYRSGDDLHRAAVDLGGIRSLLAVPLQKDGALLGAFGITRLEVRPFSEKQIALLQNFAAQAVIAMENARLLTETREALEQQTATAEVLQVINSSPGDLLPVFEAILEKAHILCGAAHGALGTYDSDYYFRSVVSRGYPALLAERLQRGFAGLTNPVTRPLIDGVRFVHIPDLAEIDHPIPQAAAAIGGFHTGLFVPLRKDGRLVGHISATRAEVRPFLEKEIVLLENFAAQAVIAMENARLLTETREALEQQTATAEVLGVINSSPGDLTPVFDAMLEKRNGSGRPQSAPSGPLMGKRST